MDAFNMDTLTNPKSGLASGQVVASMFVKYVTAIII